MFNINDYLTFSSPETFGISVNTPGWNGTMYYSTDTEVWNKWNGSEISGTVLYLAGSNNTRVTGTYNDAYSFKLSGDNISCIGNIETLLDYATVGMDEHPVMENHCYDNLFSGCTGLVQAPELPATTLKSQCYYYMFYDCTNLKFSKTQTDEYTQEYRIPTSGTGTTATNALNNMFISTGGTFTGTPEINTTYYLHKDCQIV